nr:hypothetical protein [Tanacetum cinerariifolium]
EQQPTDSTAEEVSESAQGEQMSSAVPLKNHQLRN